MSPPLQHGSESNQPNPPFPLSWWFYIDFAVWFISDLHINRKRLLSCSLVGMEYLSDLMSHVQGKHLCLACSCKCTPSHLNQLFFSSCVFFPPILSSTITFHIPPAFISRFPAFFRMTVWRKVTKRFLQRLWTCYWPTSLWWAWQAGRPLLWLQSN